MAKSKYLCPVCRAPRNVELSDLLPATTHLRIGLITFAISGIGYLIGGPAVAWKLSVSYLPLWAGSEFFHWAKMREATKCLTCDFDPVLYQKNPMEARKRVEAKLGALAEDLKNRILQKVPVRGAPEAAPAVDPKAASAAATKGPAGSSKNA